MPHLDSQIMVWSDTFMKKVSDLWFASPHLSHFLDILYAGHEIGSHSIT